MAKMWFVSYIYAFYPGEDHEFEWFVNLDDAIRCFDEYLERSKNEDDDAYIVRLVEMEVPDSLVREKHSQEAIDYVNNNYDDFLADAIFYKEKPLKQYIPGGTSLSVPISWI